jgi:hypothetical protein
MLNIVLIKYKEHVWYLATVESSVGRTVLYYKGKCEQNCILTSIQKLFHYYNYTSCQHS